MKLRDFSRRVPEEERMNAAGALQGGVDLTELTAETLADLPDTIYIANSQRVVYGKVQKETLLYLLDYQQRFRFQQILDSMNDGVIAVDGNGRIFYANPAYTDILGVPLRRVLGRKLQDVEPDSILQRTVKQREPLSSKKQLISSLHKYVSLRTFPLWDGERFLGAVSIFRDITRLHQLNQEMRQMSGIVDEYTQRIRSQETAEKMGLLSYNKSFQTVIQKAATVALTDVPLLLRGESGTGKNALAHYLHQCSRRRDKPLVVVNCAAVPADLIESVLFGSREEPGKLQVADGGTLFLAEVTELPPSAQSRLLYALQQDTLAGGENGRGSTAPDVRLIASTSQPLEPMVREERFRKELFYKLNTITIALPPLRDRPDDILPLANRFLSLYNEKYHRDITFSAETYQALQRYSWPGNLRELESYVERAVILGDSGLPIAERAEQQTVDQTERRAGTRPNGREPLAEQLRTFETEVIRMALAECQGNRTAAMAQLGLSRRTFYRKCAELGILESAKK